MRSVDSDEQVERVGLLHVLGEHEHRGARVLRADRARRAQALVGVGRRHADVDDRHVGLVGADLAQQVLPVAGLAGDLEAGLLEQAREPLAQQDGVVGDNDADGVAHTGISARRRVPAPSGERSGEVAVERGDAIGEAAQAGSAGRIGPADAVVGDLHDGVAVARVRRETRACEALAYLTTLVSASATTK